MLANFRPKTMTVRFNLNVFNGILGESYIYKLKVGKKLRTFGVSYLDIFISSELRDTVVTAAIWEVNNMAAHTQKI